MASTDHRGYHTKLNLIHSHTTGFELQTPTPIPWRRFVPCLRPGKKAREGAGIYPTAREVVFP